MSLEERIEKFWTNIDNSKLNAVLDSEKFRRLKDSIDRVIHDQRIIDAYERVNSSSKKRALFRSYAVMQGAAWLLWPAKYVYAAITKDLKGYLILEAAGRGLGLGTKPIGVAAGIGPVYELTGEKISDYIGKRPKLNRSIDLLYRRPSTIVKHNITRLYQNSNDIIT